MSKFTDRYKDSVCDVANMLVILEMNEIENETMREYLYESSQYINKTYKTTRAYNSIIAEYQSRLKYLKSIIGESLCLEKFKTVTSY